ncbi:hypothetical protein IE53DRAFT_318545, partial [Violaceomyces palustris]
RRKERKRVRIRQGQAQTSSRHHARMAAMQSHLYDFGLLKGQCSDVRIRAFGRIYSLHRLFLIQSGFFRAMLCGGFAEDLALSAALRFDDPNITRAAFEYCIAHLYGGGPKLVLPYWSSPSARDPLSPAFEIDFSPAPSQASQSVRIIPPNCQPATPRFLLSLLATSIYLNIPSITSQALTLTLCSMTPYTISHYLRFAIGKGIEGAVEAMRHSRMPSSKLPSLWDWELEGPARTLEELGRLDDTPKKQSKKGQRFKAMKFSRGRENDTASSAGKTRGGIEGVDQDDNDDDPEFHYGAPADKIGEVCACWIASGDLDVPNPWNLPRNQMPDVYDLYQAPPLRLWSYPSMPSVWVRALISSDSFFVRSEWERYCFAKRVLSLSAAKTTTSEEMDEDETEYLELFSSGIYYTHMSFQELKQIGDDVSAVTGRPFVPLNVLQAALWAGSELKNHVLSRSKPKNAFGAGGSYGDRAAFDESTDSQSLEEDLDLGISSPVDDFKKVHDSVAQAGGGRGARSRSGTPFDANVGRSPFPAHQGPDPTVTQSLGGLGTGSLLLGSAGGKAALLERRYYLVPSDDTIRYGEGLQAIHGASTSASSSGHNASSGAQPSAAPDETWTGYEPMRLGVEFFGVDKLHEKQRLYSPTFFYAGSIWNLYVQTVNKPKGIQLGVYLHRQSQLENLPLPSAPSPPIRIDNDEDAEEGSNAAPGTAAATSSIAQSAGGVGSPASPLNQHVLPIPVVPLNAGSTHTPYVYSNCPAPLISYRDTRKTLRAYFSIHCPSPLGNALTKFSSGPDQFTISQSWGWKSSSLLGAVYLEEGFIGKGKNEGWDRFRCVCTIGVV